MSEHDERDNERVCNEVPRNFLKGDEAGGCEDNDVATAVTEEDEDAEELEIVRKDTCDEANKYEEEEEEDEHLVVIDGDMSEDDDDYDDNDVVVYI